MLELLSVLKSLLIAVAVMMCLQIKVGSTSLENHMHHWVQTSRVSHYLQHVSAGAVQAIRDGSQAASGILSQTFSSNPSEQQEAGRLNFQLKRSQRYEDEQKEKSDR